ncbi:MAG: hypothetical protein IKQ46_18770 [Bacteroidales bacterium]|nr:hypothetical protein [Bacteroidales bacterium]
MKKVLLIVLLLHCFLTVISQNQCQSSLLSKDKIFEIISSKLEKEKTTLLNLRKIEFHNQYIYNYPICSSVDHCLYNCLFEYPKYGIDFRLVSYYDEQMKKRILQLLRNEFMENELDNLINKELSKITFCSKQRDIDTTSLSYLKQRESFFCQKKDSLLSEYKDKYHFNLHIIIGVCKYLYNSEIENELLRLYNSDINWSKVSGITSQVGNIQAYINLKDEIKVVLAAHGKNEFLNEWKYDETKDINWQFDIKDTLDDLFSQKMVENIRYLAAVHTEESYYELSKYLLSPRFVYSEEVEESMESDYLNDYNNYIRCFAFMYIVKNVTNIELYKSLQFLWYFEQHNNFQNIRHNLTEEFCRKVYDWMQDNRGNYKLWYEW